MTPERYQRVGQLFDMVLEIDPEARANWLDQNCGADSDLRAQVENLLAHHVDSDDFLSQPAINVAASLLAQNQRESRQGKVSHYEIISVLGIGGMGEVYLAEDLRLGRLVALKVLPIGLKDQEQRLLRLEQEARAASALNHPNILTIYETGEAHGVRFIAAEYIEGENLRDRLERERFTIEETLDLSVQLAGALDVAHRAGIIHRDVKPENVVLRGDGLVKLLDFGIAKLSEPRVTRSGSDSDEYGAQALVNTSPGTVMGTVSYMSPEQVRGQAVAASSDQWSLGVLLYEMLTGSRPFSGETASDTIASILKTEPERLTNLNPEVPAELQRIILKTLCKDSEERYQNTRDLFIDLRDLKDNLDFFAKLKPPDTQDASLVASATQVVHNSTPSYQSFAEKLITEIRIHSRGIVVAVTVLVALAAATFFLAYLRHNRPGSEAIDSLAVVPFASLKPDPTTDYLRDGLTESLITSLSRLPQLRVVPGSTMFRYQGDEADPQSVGKELGVRTVLTGRIFRHGDELIVSAELVNVADGAQLWGETYRRRTTDVAGMQQLISREISQYLRTRLSGTRERQLDKGSSTKGE